MRTNKFWRGFLSLTMILTVSLSLGACGNANAESYEEEINKEIVRMIADGELIDVAAQEEFDKEIAAIIEESDIGSVFEEEPVDTEVKVPEKAEIPAFVKSNGPDTMDIDGWTYYKIGDKYQPGEYVMVANEGESPNLSVIMDDEEHTLVAYDSGNLYQVFDTLNGQYIYFDGGKIYPISEAPEVKKTEDGAYPEGVYNVGVQLPAGEYVCKGDFISLETFVDLTGEYDSQLGYSSGARSAIITVDEGQYIKSVWGDIYPIELTEDLKPKDGVYLDGMYKVGFHMPAGTYKLKADADSAYAQIYNDSYQSRREDELAIAEPEATFTVTDGQYVSISGGDAAAQ